MVVRTTNNKEEDIIEKVTNQYRLFSDVAIERERL
jgi:hypothetical protein